jgi:hypothetical protein
MAMGLLHATYGSARPTMNQSVAIVDDDVAIVDAVQIPLKEERW